MEPMEMAQLALQGLEAVNNIDQALQNLGLISYMAAKKGNQEPEPILGQDNGVVRPVRARGGHIRAKDKYTSGHRYTANGETRTIRQWAKKLKTSPDTIRYRIRKGWSPKDVVSPVNRNLARKASRKSRKSGYWSHLTKAERSEEMTRRQAVAKQKRDAAKSAETTGILLPEGAHYGPTSAVAD